MNRIELICVYLISLKTLFYFILPGKFLSSDELPEHRAPAYPNADVAQLTTPYPLGRRQSRMSDSLPWHRFGRTQTARSSVTDIWRKTDPRLKRNRLCKPGKLLIQKRIKKSGTYLSDLTSSVGYLVGATFTKCVTIILAYIYLPTWFVMVTLPCRSNIYQMCDYNTCLHLSTNVICYGHGRFSITDNTTTNSRTIIQYTSTVGRTTGSNI